MNQATVVTSDDRGIESGPRGLTEFWRPLIWSAIVGGMVTALGVQLILTLVGVGIGAAMADPVANSTDGGSLGAGAIIWLIASGVISFAAGGWVAGHMSGVLRTGSGAMHGMAAWALAAVFGATVASLAGSPILGGAAAGVGQSRTSTSTNSISGVGHRATLPDGTVRLTDDYGRALTTAEAEQAVDNVRKAVAHASLWTGLAFLMSLAAASVGGMLGRSTPRELFEKSANPRTSGRALPA